MLNWIIIRSIHTVVFLFFNFFCLLQHCFSSSISIEQSPACSSKSVDLSEAEQRSHFSSQKIARLLMAQYSSKKCHKFLNSSTYWQFRFICVRKARTFIFYRAQHSSRSSENFRTKEENSCTFHFILRVKLNSGSLPLSQTQARSQKKEHANVPVYAIRQ